MKVLIIPAWYSEDKNVSNFILDQAYAVKNVGTEAAFLLVFIKSRRQFIKSIFKKKKISESINSIDYIIVDFYALLPLQFLKLYKLQLFLINRKALKAIKSYEILKTKFDILHFQSLCNNITPAVGYYVSQKLDRPYVITEHYTSYKEAEDVLFKPFLNKADILQVVNHSSCNISVSNFAASLHHEYFDSQFIVIPNLVPNIFKKENNREAVAGKDFVFLSVGHLTERKGFTVLIEAFIKAFGANKYVKLFIVGEGELEDLLKEKVKISGLENRVVFNKKMNRTGIIEIMDQSDVVVSASLLETFGLTLAEGFFRGLPVIATNSGGPGDVVKEYNGFLCEAGNVEDLSNKMLSMYEKYESFDKERIRKEAISTYSENAIGMQIVSQYEHAISGRGLSISIHIKEF